MAHKGGKREKAKLKYSPEIYTPEGAKSLTEKQIKAEYTRLRGIAVKRLKRFEGTEWITTQVYNYNKDKYKTLKEINNNRDLRHLLSDLSRFVMSDTGSVSGLEVQREKAVETLNDRGYKFVTRENFRQFADFMEFSRIANLAKMYDSKRIADFYQQSEHKQISEKELQRSFRKWIKKQVKQKKIQNKNPRNSDMYRNEVD